MHAHQPPDGSLAAAGGGPPSLAPPPGQCVQAPMRPRLKASVEVLDVSGTLMLLQGNGDAVSLGASDAGAALVARLVGHTSPDEIADALEGLGYGSRGAVIGAITELHELGLLENAVDDRPLRAGHRERYDRQLRYFAEVGTSGISASRSQERLAEARVVVLGLGGLGSWVVYALACTGIGRIDGIDGDVVALDNLNRQVLYAEADIGRPKVAAAADAISRFNPDIDFRPLQQTVTDSETLVQLVDGADFVVDAADWPPHIIERTVNEACFAAGVPFITMSQFPPIARVGPMYVPGQTACLACQEATYREQYPLYDQFVEARSAVRSPAATFGPVSGMIGTIAATEIVHYLAKVCEPATVGRSLMFDVRDLSVTSEHLPDKQRCMLCGPTGAARSGDSETERR